MKLYIRSSESFDANIVGAGFNRVVSHMNKSQCGFITAFRNKEEQSRAESRRKNKTLADEIKAAGLSFIKGIGGYAEKKNNTSETVEEESYLIINNKYDENTFINLMCKWCGEYNQDSVLITFPRPDKNNANGINIVGQYYDRYGKPDSSMTFENVTLTDVGDYFSRIGGKRFVLSSTKYLYHVTPNGGSYE